jgi:hypothetical protein
MRKAPAYQPCNEVGQGCKAPPIHAHSYTRATCFACGLPVCVNPKCSGRILWGRYGRQRVCRACKEDRR